MSAESCQSECQKLSACNFWTLNVYNNECIRKGSKPTSPNDVTYAISGPKYCNGKKRNIAGNIKQNTFLMRQGPAMGVKLESS